MTGDRDPTVATRTTAPPEVRSPVLQVGRLISLRFVLAALRRRRRVWLTLAAVGLVVGVAFHYVVPRSYSATATLYLAHAPGTDDGVDMANDLALLQTTSVAQRAIDRLGEPGLTPAALLGKLPGTALSDNVLVVTVSGPTRHEAVRRANALATAFLSFRSEEEQRQTGATVAALNQQIAALNQQISDLSSQINDLGSSARTSSLAELAGEQSSDTSEVTTLEQQVQQDEIADLSVADGSRVVTPGTAVHVSTPKLVGLSGISGLVGGLVIGMAIVGLQAIYSDRLRRREEVASLLGAPVAFSLPAFRHPRKITSAWVRDMAPAPSAEVELLASHLRRSTVHPGRPGMLLVVAVDEVGVPAAAVARVAVRAVTEGKTVTVVDLTPDGLLVPALHGPGAATERCGQLSVLNPSIDQVTDQPWSRDATPPDLVLVLATVDPGRGAWHVAWAGEGIVMVTAGRSSAQRVSAVAALMRAAGISITEGVLLDADDDDESLGLLEPDAPLVALPLDTVSRAPVAR